MTEIEIHLVRHGRVASHQGDMPVTEEGHAEVEAAGHGLIDLLQPGERIHLLCTAAARSRETADTLYATINDEIDSDIDLRGPREEWAIRNPDLFLAGHRVEMVSIPEAMARQIPDSGLTPEEVDAAAFFHGFFRSPDRIGYWLNHPDPPGEDAAAVGRRVVAFCKSLPYTSVQRKQRFVCVTHSPVMRAVLAHYLHHDPGEPAWVERIDLALNTKGGSITFRDRTVFLRP